jgi:hypothetical protein
MKRNKKTVQMIKRFSAYYLAVVLLMAACFDTLAQGGVAVAGVLTMQKNVSQTFNAPKNGTLQINNNYGDVNIKTWKRKTILVKVSISASSADAVKAAAFLKSIHIDFAKVADSISCTAAIGTPIQIRAMNEPDTGKGRRPITLTILPAKWCVVNFEVYLPAMQALQINNMFGNVTMGDYAGPLSINERFGNFTAGNLSGPVNFDLQQGNLHVGHLNLGLLNVKTFDHVSIGGISGALNSRFQYGRLLDVKLAGGSDSISLNANNVEQVNLSGVNTENTKYLLRVTLSKLQFNGTAFSETGNNLRFKEINVDIQKTTLQHLSDSIIKAHPELKTPPQNLKTPPDTLEKKKMMDVKMIALLAKFKKVREFAAGPENAKTQVNVRVEFGTLNLRE